MLLNSSIKLSKLNSPFSLTVVGYDPQTCSELQTDQRFQRMDNNNPGMIKNVDGSYDVYFGPKAPAGK
jgi:hypothetical protein